MKKTTANIRSPKRCVFICLLQIRTSWGSLKSGSSSWPELLSCSTVRDFEDTTQVPASVRAAVYNHSLRREAYRFIVLFVPAEVRAGRAMLMADLAVARFQSGQQEEAKMLGGALLASLRELFATCHQIHAVARQCANEPGSAHECQRNLWAVVHAVFTNQQCFTSLVLADAVLGQDYLDASAMSECPPSRTRVEVITIVHRDHEALTVTSARREKQSSSRGDTNKC